MDIDAMQRQLQDLMAFKGRVEPMLAEYERYAATRSQPPPREPPPERPADQADQGPHPTEQGKVEGVGEPLEPQQQEAQPQPEDTAAI